MHREQLGDARVVQIDIIEACMSRIQHSSAVATLRLKRLESTYNDTYVTTLRAMCSPLSWNTIESVTHSAWQVVFSSQTLSTSPLGEQLKINWRNIRTIYWSTNWYSLVYLRICWHGDSANLTTRIWSTLLGDIRFAAELTTMDRRSEGMLPFGEILRGEGSSASSGVPGIQRGWQQFCHLNKRALGMCACVRAQQSQWTDNIYLSRLWKIAMSRAAIVSLARTLSRFLPEQACSTSYCTNLLTR